VTSESNVFHFDMNSSLTRLYGDPTDPVCPIQIAQKLATLCITLNEFPSIKYQISSAYATTIATTTLNILENFKRTNTNFWSHGDDGRQDRERGILLIVDRSFDPLSPLMHEFTYQAMVNDLLPVKDGIISIVAETNAGSKVEKKAILNEADEYWVSLRHQHIASVIDYMKERMSDIITNNPSAALAKKSGADMSITAMAAAVKALPEYRETMAKLSQHVNITQKCMDVFTTNNLLEIHALEEKMSTGEDDDGKQVKQPDLLKQLIDMLIMPDVSQQIKIRLLSIFFLTRGSTATAEERRRLIQAANLTGPEQQILLNFERGLGATLLQSTNTRAASGQSAGGILSMFKGKSQAKHEPTPEGQYAESRHKCRLKGILESLMGAEGSEALPNDLFASIGPAGNAVPVAKSARKYANHTKFAKNSNRTMFQSSRYVVCIAGGVASSELRTAYELMGSLGKEVIIGGTHLINPNIYLKDVASLNTRSADASRLFEIEFPGDEVH
jgi:syntaxin-binding protein 1